MIKIIICLIFNYYLYKIGILDSGVSENLEEYDLKVINFTNDNNNLDYINHGTYTINILKGKDKNCPGYDIKNEIIILKIFNKELKTNNQIIENALKYIEKNKIKIIGLPFSYYELNKNNKNFINKLINHGYIFIAASGNEGPSFGSLGIPGNMQRIITLGSINKLNNKISKFSSNGPNQYIINKIIFKPDFLINGEGYYKSNKICEKRKGTTISVIKSLYLISNILKYEKYINQSIIYTYFLKNSLNIKNKSVFKQGNGILNWNFDKKLDIENIYINPNKIDFTKKNMFPYNQQPLFYGKNKYSINTKIISIYDNYIIFVNYKIKVYPSIYSKYLDIKIKNKNKIKFIGIINIIIKLKKKIDYIIIDIIKLKLKIEFNYKYFNEIYSKDLTIKFEIMKRPSNIYLFDMKHNKNLTKSDIYKNYLKFDFKGDSWFTNYTNILKIFKKYKIYYEINYKYLSCIKKRKYKGIIIIDPELDFDNNEIYNWIKLFKNGINIIIISEYYTTENNNQDNNLLNLNYFLSYFNIELGFGSFKGNINFNNQLIKINSSTYIRNFPYFGKVFFGKILQEDNNKNIFFKKSNLPIFGLADFKIINNWYGKISILSDSTCLEDGEENDCLVFLEKTFEFFNNEQIPKELIDYKNIQNNIFLNDFSKYSLLANKNNKCLKKNIKLKTPIYIKEKEKINYLFIFYFIIFWLLLIILLLLCKRKIKIFLLKRKLKKIPKYSIVYI